MACQRSPPPSSPRAPKIQQESWDDCDSPPIDLFNPCHHNPPRSPTRVQPPPKSPKSPRKFNKPIINQTPPYCDAKRNSPKSSSSRSSFHSSGSNTDQRSPKYLDNPPRSPKITTTYANDDNNDDDNDDNDDDDNDDVIIDNPIVDLDIDSTTGSYYQTPPTGSSRNSKPSSSSGGASYYYDQYQQQSPRRSPKSPRKFVFDAISPSYESKGRKFEYFDPTSLDTNPGDDADIESIDQEEPSSRYVRTHPLSSRCQTPPKSSSTSLLSSQQQQQQQQQQQPLQQSQQCPIPPSPSSALPNSLLHQRRESKKFPKNFAGILSSISTIPSSSSSNKIGMSLNHCGVLGNSNNSGNNNRYHRHHSSQQHHLVQQTSHLLDEFPSGNRCNLYVKRDSCMTESTQLSGDSCETNATTLTTTTTFISSSTEEGQIIETQPSPIGGIGAGTAAGIVGCNRSGIGSPVLITSNSGQVSPICQTKGGGSDKGSSGKKDLGKRRHAINITSNPAYQVLHGSHSTLDRTCSDSVVSLKYRKSTSDLTKVDDGAAPIVTKNSRRRGSSKGGLAYLASRRSSRDSVKSICSNTSNFSNEDIGPLAFQASSRSRQRRTSNFLELPIPDHIRPRVCSLPDRPYNPRVSDDLYRLRHFSISKGTVVNCGDSIISRRSRSNTSVNSTTSRASERSPFEGSCCGGGYANVDSMPPSPSDDSEPPPPPRYRIVMLGEAGVGKTALVSQFMTSEYMHTYDASLDDEFGEKTVSVLLDDEESELVFIDHPSVEMSVENSLTTYEPHACVVIYSVVDRNSFRVAEETINYLWSENVTKEKAVILVGNKADLARSRVITMSEGKSLAASRDAKFIETSSGIQHNVDELLVGILKQIRLKERRDKKAAQTSSKMKNSRTQISLHLAKEILQKICLSDITKSKSCENLHVL